MLGKPWILYCLASRSFCSLRFSGAPYCGENPTPPGRIPCRPPLEGLLIENFVSQLDAPAAPIGAGKIDQQELLFGLGLRFGRLEVGLPQGFLLVGGAGDCAQAEHCQDHPSRDKAIRGQHHAAPNRKRGNSTKQCHSIVPGWVASKPRRGWPNGRGTKKESRIHEWTRLWGFRQQSQLNRACSGSDDRIRPGLDRVIGRGWRVRYSKARPSSRQEPWGPAGPWGRRGPSAGGGAPTDGC